MPLHRWQRRARRGMAALEVVLVTGLALPMAAVLFWLLVLTVRRFFGMLGNGVGMPYL
ncbi:MAG TPA: hypothetical protein VH643_21020 [Gemmataceae bacterium]|jgi:hypothetical protein